MDENMKKMELFFELDLKIKELIIKMKPPMLNYDEQYYIKYVDILLSNLKKIEDIYCYFIDYLGMNINIKDLIRGKFKNYESRFITCNYEYNKLQKEYENSIYSMTPGLENKIQENFQGYTHYDNEFEVLKECVTINDMLHAFHSYLVNNEKFYEQMQITNDKILKSNGLVNLCGNDNRFATDLFNNFPEQIKTFKTDILSFDNMILIMSRDLGHALTIEIFEEENNLRVKYFIPKVCNIEKVNKLKGVTKLDPETDSIFDNTTGEFVVSKDNFVCEMIDFINGVPTDDDLNIYKIT